MDKIIRFNVKHNTETNKQTLKEIVKSNRIREQTENVIKMQTSMRR